MSDNETKVVSILDQFRPKKKEETAQETYQAAEISRSRVIRLRVHYNNGDIEAISYVYIKNMLSVALEHIGLLCSTGVISIRGENLRPLLDELQEERVRSLQPFDAAKHKAPKEDSPVIHTITWKKAEELREV